MEITKVRYRKTLADGNVRLAEHAGIYTVVEGGIVLVHSKASQTFLPYSQIESIEQSIVGHDVTDFEIMEKSLYNRHRRR